MGATLEVLDRHVEPQRYASVASIVGDNDDVLVARVRAGDDTAFEKIYDRYARGVLAFCAHMLKSREAAEDAVQLTFVSAYRAMRRTHNEIALRPWLYTIARNRCLSEIRARQDVEYSEFDPPLLDDLSDQVERREALREMLDDIRRLPEDQRAALVLFELGDNSHKEIAAILDVRVGKVKALIFQARKALARGRVARDHTCRDVQEQISELLDAVPRRSVTRAHIDRCLSCKSFEAETRRQRAALALILPVPLAAGIKSVVLGAMVHGGAAAAGAGMTGGGAAATGAGVTGGGAAAGAGVTGGGAAATGAGVTGGGAIATGTGVTAGGAALGSGATIAGGAGVGTAATGGLASVATGVTGSAVAAGGTVAVATTGLTVAGVSGLGATGVVAKILTAAAVAVGASQVGGSASAPRPIPRSATRAPAPSSPLLGQPSPFSGVPSAGAKPTSAPTSLSSTGNFGGYAPSAPASAGDSQPATTGSASSSTTSGPTGSATSGATGGSTPTTTPSTGNGSGTASNSSPSAGSGDTTTNPSGTGNSTTSIPTSPSGGPATSTPTSSPGGDPSTAASTASPTTDATSSATPAAAGGDATATSTPPAATATTTVADPTTTPSTAPPADQTLAATNPTVTTSTPPSDGTAAGSSTPSTTAIDPAAPPASDPASTAMTAQATASNGSSS